MTSTFIEVLLAVLLSTMPPELPAFEMEHDSRFACVRGDGVALVLVEKGFIFEGNQYFVEHHRVLVGDVVVAREVKLEGGDIGLLHNVTVRFNLDVIPVNTLDPTNQFVLSEMRDVALEKSNKPAWDGSNTFCAYYQFL